ncbi:sugar transferase, partial [Helicobacter sp. Faydin-H70]|nr:sugar transferase [Helicobacter turcicus]
ALKLPPLESYSDYKEALRFKEHLSYKLGNAFLKAYKNVWGGGIIKYIFIDVPRIKREWREKQKEKKCY